MPFIETDKPSQITNMPNTDDKFLSRGAQGKFTTKSANPRKVRSVNLTDWAWTSLERLAKEHGQTRNDFLESLTLGEYPFMETDKPFIEMDELTALREQNQKLEAEIAILKDEIYSLKSQIQSQAPQKAVDPFDLLNGLKGRRKKSKAVLADIEAIVEILENE